MWILKKGVIRERKRLDLWKFGISLYVKWWILRDIFVSYIKCQEKQGLKS